MQQHALVVVLATTLNMIVFLLRLLLSQKEVLLLLTLNWSAELYDVLLLKNSDVTTLRVRMRIIIAMKLLQLCAYARAIN